MFVFVHKPKSVSSTTVQTRATKQRGQLNNRNGVTRRKSEPNKTATETSATRTTETQRLAGTAGSDRRRTDGETTRSHAEIASIATLSNQSTRSVHTQSYLDTFESSAQAGAVHWLPVPASLLHRSRIRPRSSTRVVGW